MVGDTTSINIGHNKGLWKIFQDYRLEKFSEPVASLITIWCCAYTTYVIRQVWHGRQQSMKHQKLTIC